MHQKYDGLTSYCCQVAALLVYACCLTAISSDKQDNIAHDEPFMSLLKFVYYEKVTKISMYVKMSQLI